LANLFMHHAFDAWMARNFPGCPFERYADDAVVHCKSRRQAEYVLTRMGVSDLLCVRSGLMVNGCQPGKRSPRRILRAARAAVQARLERHLPSARSMAR
jgi:hypothetical protein